jgi:hypothetical protein
MELIDQIRALQVNQGNPAKPALATVDLAYPALSDPERAALKDTLEATAIPHWCNESILASLLNITQEESSDRLTKLKTLTVVEQFPARGATAVNVHEAARLALRKQLAEAAPERFQALSANAARYFSEDLTSADRSAGRVRAGPGDQPAPGRAGPQQRRLAARSGGGLLVERRSAQKDRET